MEEAATFGASNYGSVNTAFGEEFKNQEGLVNDELTRQSVEKIVADFRVSL